MKLELPMFAAPAIVAILALLAGCGGQDDPAPANTGGSPVGGASAASGGSGGLGSAGRNTAAVGGGSSTAGASGSGSTVPATFATVKLVFGGGGGIMTCSAAPCHGVHGMAPPDNPLELPPNDDQQLYKNLTSHVSKACNDTKVVNPGNPAQSALVTILKGPCGRTPRMPYGCSAQAGDCIPDEYIAAVTQWIANGAPQQ
jgi:hypothetical protein